MVIVQVSYGYGYTCGSDRVRRHCVQQERRICNTYLAKNTYYSIINDNYHHTAPHKNKSPNKNIVITVIRLQLCQ